MPAKSTGSTFAFEDFLPTKSESEQIENQELPRFAKSQNRWPPLQEHILPCQYLTTEDEPNDSSDDQAASAAAIEDLQKA